MPNLLARQASRLEENLYRLLAADSTRAYRIALACLLVLVLAATALMLLTGAVHQRLYPCDQAMLLDGGWRLLQGQRPHIDFFTNGGGITYYVPVLLGLVVGGPQVSALAYGPAILLTILSLWAWWLARRRLPALASLAFAAMVGGLVAGVFPLGGRGWRIFSYAMQYNRFGWSLLCLLALTMLIRPRQVLSWGRESLEGVGSGLLLSLLILLKVGYAGAAVMLVVLGLLSHRRKGSFWLGIAVACFGLALAYTLYMRGNVAACLHDVSGFVAAHQSGHILLHVATVAWACAMELWPLGLIVLLALRPISAAGQSREAIAGWLKALAAAAVLRRLGSLGDRGKCPGL